MTTRERLIALAEREPSLNLTEAAGRVGVTRERVRQLANKYSLPFHRGWKQKPHSPCDLCSKMDCTHSWSQRNRERNNAWARDDYKRNRDARLGRNRRWIKGHPEQAMEYRLRAYQKYLERAGYSVVAPEKVPA